MASGEGFFFREEEKTEEGKGKVPSTEKSTDMFDHETSVESCSASQNCIEPYTGSEN